VAEKNEEVNSVGGEREYNLSQVLLGKFWVYATTNLQVSSSCRMGLVGWGALASPVGSGRAGQSGRGLEPPGAALESRVFGLSKNRRCFFVFLLDLTAVCTGR
tara:strand:- start:2354 stop:2662 length:309 start_codon:yes stop_codon:yes gene_type:complete